MNFNISQVGDDSQAGEFLESLKNDNEIQDVLHCTAGERATYFFSSHFQSNSRSQNTWMKDLKN